MSDQTRTSDSADSDSFPLAQVQDANDSVGRRTVRTVSRYWWLTLACLAVAIALAATSTRSQGPKITISFQHGHGLEPGNSLRHLGIEVGEITDVQLREGTGDVVVQVALQASAGFLARHGSRFWIERPQLSLARASGLETVLGAKYIDVLPGSPDGAKQTEFEGLETPPTLRASSDVTVTIRFKNGHGLRPGDLVRFRGIDAGEVADVRLNETLDHVEVQARLMASAVRLARAGTQFWIERPAIGFGGVRGLDTIVGGRYLAVLPGSPDAASQANFVGLENPPAAADRIEGALEITLAAAHRNGVERGAPVTYRGLRVGHILSVGLSTDSISVEARAVIQPQYRNLVRSNSVFWSTSGIDLRLGITGFQLDAETLSTIAAGGVAFSTPSNPGETVRTGHRFVMANEAQDDWLTWQPRITAGQALTPGDQPPPPPVRAMLSWRTSRFRWPRSRHAQGWLAPVEGSRLLGPTELLIPPEDAAQGYTSLEVAGQIFQVESSGVNRFGRLAFMTTERSFESSNPTWPVDRVRRPVHLEDCLLTTGPQDMQLAISKAQLEKDGDIWKLDPSLSLDSDWHGAEVISLIDGSLIGIVVVEDGRGAVARVPRKDQLQARSATEPAADLDP